MLNRARINSNFIAFVTLLRKETTRFTRIWVQTLLPSAITITLYFIIFGHLLGSQLGKINGVSYMQYITPGLIMMPIITNSYTNVVSSFYGIKFQKSIEEILISPMPNSLILLGFCAGGVMRSLAIGIIVTAIALLFTHLYIYNIVITLSIALLTATLFSLAGFTNAVFAKKFDDISIVPTFVLTPLVYLGGVFYSVSQFSPFWQTLAKVNPILYIVNSFRYGVLGITDINIRLAFIIITLAVITMFYFNLYLLRKGIGLRT